MFCKNCGQPVPDDAKVCGQCGQFLKTTGVDTAGQYQAGSPAPRKGRFPAWGWGAGILLLGGIIVGLVVLWNSLNTRVAVSRPQSVVPVPSTPAPVPETCVDQVKFISDVTVPDGTVLEPDTPFQKTWRVKNTGSCTWTPAYLFVYLNGNQMGGVNSLPLPASVPPGETLDISIDLKSPPDPGDYTGFWIFQNEEGSQFGIGSQGTDPIWVKIKVAASSSTGSGGQSAALSGPAPAGPDRCGLFGSIGDPIWMDMEKGSTVATFYVKIPGGIPGLEKEISGDQGPWEYHATIGNYETGSCSFQGYKERLYCDFPIPSGYANSAHPLKLYVNGCTRSILEKQTVDVPAFNEAGSGGSGGSSSGGGCSAGLGASACSAAGGTYQYTHCMVPPCPEFCNCP